VNIFLRVFECMLRGVACEAFERGEGGATDMAVVPRGVGVDDA